MSTYYPSFISQFGIGGNTNGTNTYQSISVSSLTAGTQTAETLRGGYNLSCFAFLSTSQLAPVWLNEYYEDVGTTVAPRLLAKLPGFVSGLGCGRLYGWIGKENFERFPGFVESLGNGSLS
jgi:ribose/xylose/arabinose/galactoside ABC-type transport system permease subunit